MNQKEWLPHGVMLADGSRIVSFLAAGMHWQIFRTSYNGTLLAADAAVLERWSDTGLVAMELFTGTKYSEGPIYLYTAKQGDIISSVQQGPYPSTVTEAQAFAVALRETRRLVGTVSLHDSLYIEKISRLLPCYDDTDFLDDKTVLGMWLSAGVIISTDSFRRLHELTRWMDAKLLEGIIASAGFDMSLGNTLQKTKFENEKETEGMAAVPLQRTEARISSRFLLPGRPVLEDFFNDHVVDIIKNEEKYKQMGIGFPSAIVLYGKPGSGKTYAVDRLVEYLGWPCFTISSGSIGSPYIHDTSRKVAELFDKAIESAPSVVVIDEMEAFLADRTSGIASGLHHVEEVAEFLRRIPEATSRHVLVVAMTNLIEIIDPAVLRRGRFDHIIEVTMPTKEEVLTLLTKMTEKLLINRDIDFGHLADELQGRPLSDTAYVVKEAGRITASRDREAIDAEAFQMAIRQIPVINPRETRRIGFDKE